MKRARAVKRQAETSAQTVLRLEEWLPYHCSVVANAVSLRLAGFYHRKFGLSIHAWRVMAVLGRNAPLSALELARITAMDQVSVTRAINDLSALDMVERRTDSKDRRKVALRLSAHGRRTYQEIVPLALELEIALVAGLTQAERATLGRLMSRVRENAMSLRTGEEPSGDPPSNGERAAPRRAANLRPTKRMPRIHAF